MRPYKRVLKVPGRMLRREMTEAEQVLWARIRRKQVNGVQFYRQKPIADFIVDFFGPKAGLVIEVDGSQHLEEDHAARDEHRDEVLAQLELRVLRFSNFEVIRQTDVVLERIREAVEVGQAGPGT